MANELLSDQIYDMAISCGFDNCGIISVDDMDGFDAHLQERTQAVPSSAFFYEAAFPKHLSYK